jgi:hypothetical protein
MASTDGEPFWYTYASFFTVCLYVLGHVETLPERFAFKPSSVDAVDRENMALMLLYLSPLFSYCYRCGDDPSQL